MARRRKKEKQKRVASVEGVEVVKRDLKQSLLWISVAVAVVLAFALVQDRIIG